MLLEEGAIGEAISLLGDAGSTAFSFEKHQKLYGHIVDMYDRTRPIDGVVIKDELERRNLFDELGGYEFLGGLISAVPSAQRVRHYAEIVIEKHMLRELIGATHRVMDSAFDGALPAQEILDYAEQEIFGVTERRVSSGAQALPDLIEELFQKIQDLDGSVPSGEPSGYAELDELTCGFQPSELIIVAGRPSMGKTALGLNIAENLALVEGRPVLFFSLEMSRQQLAQRILCSRAKVDSHLLRRGKHSARDLHDLQAAAEQIKDKPLLVDDTSHLSILELRARARMAYRKFGIRALFVDYLQLMHVPGAESRQAEVAQISRGLKAMAKELNIPVIAMAQLNRNPEDRAGNRPRISDLRESGAIEQDADVVILLHREGYYKDAGEHGRDDEGLAELIVAKQRNGPVGTVELHFNKKYTRFDHSAHHPERYEDVAEAQTDEDGPAPF